MKLFALALLAATLSAQTFEIASVRRVKDGPPPGDIPTNLDPAPGHLAMRNVPLRHAILWAYDLKDFQVTGPDWIKGDERYDIIAKAAKPVPESQVRVMLQALLADRFQLKLHHEPKEMSVYVLTSGKGAPKVAANTDSAPPSLGGSAAGTAFHNQPISRFTFLLTRRLDRPVLDQTGLAGRYDFAIDLSGLGFGGRPPADPSAPSVFTTVQRDLNLKLEARKEKVDIVIVDSATRTPAEN